MIGFFEFSAKRQSEKCPQNKVWLQSQRTQPSGGCSEKKLWGIILTETGQKEIIPSGLGAGWPSYGKGAQQ
jgi:hypothetical protein